MADVLGSDLSILSIPEIYKESICLIEWPQRMAETFRPSQYLQVTITIGPYKIEKEEEKVEEKVEEREDQAVMRTVELRFEGDGENENKCQELMKGLESLLAVGIEPQNSIKKET